VRVSRLLYPTAMTLLLEGMRVTGATRPACSRSVDTNISKTWPAAVANQTVTASVTRVVVRGQS
jgi:hypothetical protein